MNIVTDPRRHSNLSSASDTPGLQNYAVASMPQSPNLWLPDTMRRRHPGKPWVNGTGVSVSSILFMAGGLHIPCVGCGEVMPGIVSDCLTGRTVDLTVDVWERLKETRVSRLEGECPHCGCAFLLPLSATIASTAEYRAFSDALWDDDPFAQDTASVPSTVADAGTVAATETATDE